MHFSATCTNFVSLVTLPISGSSLAASSTSTPLWHLRQAGNKTRHFNSLARHEVEDKEDEKEQQLDLEAEMKGEMEGEGEGESFHSAVSTGVMNSSQSIGNCFFLPRGQNFCFG